MPFDSFMTSLIGDQAPTLHDRLTIDLGWTHSAADDFLTRTGLSLLGHLRNSPNVSLATLCDPEQQFTLVNSLDLRAIASHSGVGLEDAWRAAGWVAAAVCEGLHERAMGRSTPVAVALAAPSHPH